MRSQSGKCVFVVNEYIRENRGGGVIISVLAASVLVSPTFISPAVNMLLLLLLLSSGVGKAQRVMGQKNNGSCVCEVNSKMWSFPAASYGAVLQQVQSCEGSLKSLQEKVELSSQRLPEILALIKNLTDRLEPHQYLHDQGLYTDLSLHLLSQELSQLETDIVSIHSQLNNTQTRTLSKEVGKLRADVVRMKMSDTINMKTVKEKLRYLKNTAESCKSIPKDFRGQHPHCLKGLMSNISDPVTTKVSPYGKSYISGSWGKQAQVDSEGQRNSYWVQPLLNSHIWGNTLRVYQTHEDFMASANHRDFTFAPSYTHADAIEGPSAALYGEALYYHCYRSADVCRYDLNSNTVKRVTLPGTGVGFNNKFPYCYYDCRANTDVDIEADEMGLWALYATVGNHGNLVVSRLIWDNEAETLNVSQTWETRIFKRAVSNAFMVCGVLYATRYVDEYSEEVFYAFDTATGKEDNSLALPMEKVAKGVASLSYNPTNRMIYMYNDGYLLAYQAHF
ncbi:olfactomedin-like [Epinephelus moara]|uniref:olfactomedin-like n=1 Tax=Epinephelus moara TaxID=300413 RepID=UPI00214EC736|nr:olfactomedin-like [Epinephelus moara]